MERYWNQAVETMNREQIQKSQKAGQYWLFSGILISVMGSTITMIQIIYKRMIQVS